MNASMNAGRSLRLALIAALAAVMSGTLRAESVATTAPLGFTALSVPGGSDAVISAPLVRPARHVVAVAGAAGSVVLLAGAPGWGTNELVRNGAVQPETYYLAFNDGAKAGQYFTIVANTDASVTLDLAGDSLDDVQPGDTVRIVPYWTFGTLFPGGAGVTGSSTHGTRATEVLVYDHAAVGTNLSPAWTYYYYTGTNPGWRRVGGGLSTVRDGDIIAPDSYLLYRQNTPAAQAPVVLGEASTSTIATIVSTLQSGVAQDNHLAYAVPVPLTLAQLNLVQSGAFEGSASHGARRDELYVFDNAAIGQNKSPSAVYYYFTGANPGWRRVGGGVSTVRDDDIVLQPGQGFIIRKAASPVPQSHVVRFTPSYH
jgi:uncharacterized protein (TIGR02597 family)